MTTKKNKKIAESIEKILIFLISILLFSSIAAASTSITLVYPDNIEQGQDNTVSLVLQSDQPFPGIVFASFQNMESTLANVGFDNSSFQGTGPYQASFTWQAKGISAGSYDIKINITDAFLTTVASTGKAGTVNSAAPVITASSPTGIIPFKEAVMSVE